MEYLGNITLLDQEKHGFLCSRCTRSSAILPCLDWAVERAHGTEPVMSTFHSELESAVLDMLLRGICPIIIVLGRRPYKAELPPNSGGTGRSLTKCGVSITSEHRNITHWRITDNEGNVIEDKNFLEETR